MPFITLSSWTEKEFPMDNIRIIYWILKVLEGSMDAEEMDGRIISAETLDVSRSRLLSVLRMLIQAGPIEGERTCPALLCSRNSFTGKKDPYKILKIWDPASNFTWNSLPRFPAALTVIMKRSISKTAGSKRVFWDMRMQNLSMRSSTKEDLSVPAAAKHFTKKSPALGVISGVPAISWTVPSGPVSS